MTTKRMAEISAEANSNEHTGHLTPLVEECLSEIERLKAEKQRMADEIYRLRDQFTPLAEADFTPTIDPAHANKNAP